MQCFGRLCSEPTPSVSTRTHIIFLFAFRCLGIHCLLLAWDRNTRRVHFGSIGGVLDINAFFFPWAVHFISFRRIRDINRGGTLYSLSELGRSSALFLRGSVRVYWAICILQGTRGSTVVAGYLFVAFLFSGCFSPTPFPKLVISLALRGLAKHKMRSRIIVSISYLLPLPLCFFIVRGRYYLDLCRAPHRCRCVYFHSRV